MAEHDFGIHQVFWTAKADQADVVFVQEGSSSEMHRDVDADFLLIFGEL
jgi:hypothetical protein